MKINMSEVQYKKLLQLCSESKKELSGIMDTQFKNGEIYVVGIKLDEPDVVESSNSIEIVYNNKQYITKTIYELNFLNSPVYIRFHTHPLFGGATNLSKADIDNLKYVQGLARRIEHFDSNSGINVVSGVVTNSEIAFYSYDLEMEKVIRIPLFVNGIEKIPSIEKSAFQIFKEGFLEGRKKFKG